MHLAPRGPGRWSAVGVCTDITARRRAEAEARASERRLRALHAAAERQARDLIVLDQARTALARELDLPALLRAVVEAIAASFGHTHVTLYLLEGEELVRQGIVGPASDRLARIPVRRGIMGRVARTGAPVLLEDVASDPDFIRAAADIVSAVCVPLFDQGRVAGVLNLESVDGARLGEDDLRLMLALGEHVGLALERARLYAAAQASERRYRLVIEQVQEVLFQTDAAGAWTFLSPAWTALTGFAVAESLGRPFLDYVHPDDRARNLARFRPLIAGEEETCRHEIRYRTAAGDHRWIEVHARLTRAADGAVAGTAGTLTDVTARQQAERRGAIFSALGQQLSATTAAREAARIIAAAADDLLGWDALLLDLYAAETGLFRPLLDLDVVDGRRTEVRTAAGPYEPGPMLRRTLAERAQLLLRGVAAGDGPPAPEAPLELFGDTARRSASLMFVPIRSATDIVGVLSIQSYTPRSYTTADLATLQALADHCGGALERLRGAEAYRASEAGLVEAQRIAHLGNWWRDLDTGEVFFSDELYRIHGLEPGGADLGAGGLLALVHPADAARVRAWMDAVPAGHQHGIDHRIVRPDGEVRYVLQQVAPTLDAAGRLRCLSGTMLDITERKALEDQLAHQAFHDALTGLPNRALFLDRLGHALERGAREGAAVGVLLLDLDGFKHVNDSLGHATGDRLLAAFAARLPGCCLRPGDTLARLGGDEFAVLLEGVHDADDVPRVAERIATSPALQAPYPLDGREVVVRASLGVTVGRAGACDPTTLLRDADTALYRAKAAGKGGYAVFDPGMAAEAVARLELEEDLRGAVKREELSLAYQPVVALADGRVRRAEALARWQHPARGPVSSAVFVALAEVTGLIRPLGRWVLGEACRQAAAWRRARGDQAPVVCVNLSAREFADPDLAPAVERALREAGLDPMGLELEITEGALMGDAPGTLTTLRQLKDLGVGLAIDDFGTGYSSLAYLKCFPVDTLKIDKAFVDELGADSEDTAIVGAVVGLAHALGLEVIAEGVETATQAAGLRRLGCDLAQGYHFARPLPAPALDALLAAGPLPLPDDPAPAALPAPATGERRQRRAGGTHRLLPLPGGRADGSRARR